MLVWNGYAGEGGRYDPEADVWRPLSEAGEPAPRFGASSVWTGAELIVWGGRDPVTARELGTGARYDPAADAWRPMETENAPRGRHDHTAVWTGQHLIVWGGDGGSEGLRAGGGRYDPAEDRWTAPAQAGEPEERSFHTAVWTGTDMIVWGGGGAARPFTLLDTGGRYRP
jgi:hypothetical protein